MTKKLPDHIKLQRKPISRACAFCHEKHLQCDTTRPCKNCTKRNVGGKCQDVERKRNRPRKGSSASASSGKKSSVKISESRRNSLSVPMSSEPSLNAMENDPLLNEPDDKHHKPPFSAQFFIGNSPPSTSEFVSHDNPQLVSLSKSSSVINHDDETGFVDNFDAKFDFFDQLNDTTNENDNMQKQNVDFTSLFYDGLNNQAIHRPYISLGNEYQSEFGTTPSEDYGINNSQKAITPDFMTIQHEKNAINHNVSVRDFASHFKNSQNYKSPLSIRKQVFQEVSDLYSKFPVFDFSRLQKQDSDDSDFRTAMGILSFSYMKSYQELIKYFYDRLYLQTIPTNIDYKGLSNDEIQKSKLLRRKLFLKMLEKIWTIHNHFRIQSALIQTDLTFLTNFSDSLLTEMILQRQLLNFENMISNFTSTPAIIWRRSTEIVFMSDELCHLIGIKSKSRFLSKRRFLCEIIDDISILNYFKLFNNLVIGAKDQFHNVNNRVKKAKNRFSEIIDDLEDELNDERFSNDSKVISGGLIRFNCKFINQNYNPDGSRNHIDDFHMFENSLTADAEATQKPFINSSSILTIKKDMFDIPMLIVGQFLPILE